MGTMKCSSCGETVLYTDQFCGQCGKLNEQTTEHKSENSVAAEDSNKKCLLTFDALDQSVEDVFGIEDGIDAFGMNVKKITYSIEVDGDFIGEINPGEKIETFVAKGKHNIILKRSRSFIPNEEEILVEDNQTILLYNLYYFFPAFLINPSDSEKEEIWQRDNKIAKTGGLK